MAEDKKISQLAAATTPLAGTEVTEIVQGGVNKQVAVSNFGTSVSAASETEAGIMEIARQDETNLGSDDARAVTPKKLNNHPAITLFMYNNFI